jgi:hypothetical protein
MMSDFNSNERFEDRLLFELKQHVASQPAPAMASQSGARNRPFARPVYRVALAGATIVAIAGVAVAVGRDPVSPAYAVESQSDGAVTVEISSLQDAAGLQSQLRAQGINAVVDFVPAGKTCQKPRFARGAHDSDTSAYGTANGPANGSPGGASLQSETERPPGAPKIEGKKTSGAPEGTVIQGESTHISGDKGPHLVGKETAPDGSAPPAGALLVMQKDGVAKFTIPAGTVPKGKTIVIDGNSGVGASSVSLEIGEGAVSPCVLTDLPSPNTGPLVAPK